MSRRRAFAFIACFLAFVAFVTAAWFVPPGLAGPPNVPLILLIWAGAASAGLGAWGLIITRREAERPPGPR